MKFRLTENLNYSNIKLTTLERVLVNRYIDLNKINDYININSSALLDRGSLNFIKEGALLLKKHFDKGSKIFLQVDSDADGYTSSAYFLNYVYRLNPNYLDLITYRLHDGKEHGIILDTIIGQGYDLVIAIDASSNQIEEHRALKELGIDVLVIDHHECEELSDAAIVINNQMSPNYENKALCGVAMAYKFAEEMDSLYGTIIAEDLIDLVAIGLIGDMMDMRSFETHYLTQLGISNITNPLISALVEKQSYSIGDMLTRHGAAFYIVPLINATIRTGTDEEKQTMFDAMLEFKAFEDIPSTKRGAKGTYEKVVEQAIRNCTNVHARQRKMRIGGADSLVHQIQENKIDKHKIMVVKADETVDKNLIGLIAMQLAAEYKHPVLLLREHNIDGVKMLQGSGRNYDRGGLTDFKGFLSDSGMFEYAEGHASAFGAGIRADRIEDFIQYADEKLENISFDPSYEVDFIFSGSDIDKEVIYDIATMKPIWGKGLDEPYVAIQSLALPANRVQLLSPDKKPTLKITLPNGLSMIKFFSSHEEYSKLTPNSDGYILINIIGKCAINTFRGANEPQLFIEEYEIQDVVNYLF